MDFGLTEKQLESIRALFERYSEVTSVKVFGSRAMGNFRANSDVDLVCWGELDELLLSKILGDLEQLPMPYFFDLQAYENIRNTKLKEHIDTFGKPLYVKAVNS